MLFRSMQKCWKTRKMHDIINPFWTDVDEIYNLACPASPIHYQHDAIKTAKTAVFGTFNMLGLAKRNKAKILQASTSEVYGDPLSHPQREGDWGNVNPIAKSKLANSRYFGPVLVVLHKCGMQVVKNPLLSGHHPILRRIIPLKKKTGKEPPEHESVSK